jgi:hypothetical protein
MGGTDPASVDHASDRLGVACQNDFDLAIGAVTDPAVQAAAAGFVRRPGAISHTLYAAGNKKMADKAQSAGA